jgi:hypothetical protein
LLAFGRNPQNGLGGKLGFIAILHTWDQLLNAHFHLHCLIPGGAVSDDCSQWIACKNDYLFNQDALSLVFRGKFIDRMTQACKNGQLKFADDSYKKLKNTLFTKKWVVSVREPVKQPEHVLEYLSRYTHRVAIANSRIKALKDGMVTFTAKNRKKKCPELITISAVEFIRRFLLHSLPKRFVKNRYYGFLANRNRKKNLKTIRLFMGLAQPAVKDTLPLEEMMQKITGIDISICPVCNEGKMQFYDEIPRSRARAPNRLLGVVA